MVINGSYTKGRESLVLQVQVIAGNREVSNKKWPIFYLYHVGTYKKTVKKAYRMDKPFYIHYEC
ncbi:putative N-acyltransferase [Peribacillus deserti]|uniref:N-acyltransferase n=1 Tax=Peribacillus deserti TaxID=673318 RepID=A0ABS2QMH7_9BACI|nr:putative N-acyltransferase [Peribacillus deserti]